jgi:uroporphyrinogen decarboxylase
MENLLVGFIESPDAVHDLMRRITDYNLAAVGIATEYKELDAVMFGDDWGQQRSLIMGREHWVTFIKPYLKEMYGAAKRAGKLVLQHSCGNIESVFDDVIELGLDAYQTFQPEIYDIEKVKARYGGRLSFWGGISTQQLLPTATPEFLRSEIIRIMRIMGKGGGYIAAPTHSVPRDVPAENILTMIDVFKNQKANGI